MPDHEVPLEQRVEAYAQWVRELRERGAAAPLVTDADPLARLGRELELLSAMVSRREAELRRLFELVHTVESGVLLDDVLEKVFNGFRDIIPFDRIGCAFLSDDHSRVIAYWARSELGVVKLPRGFEQPLAGSSLEEILRTGRPRIINDLEAYLAAKPASVSTRRIVEEGGRSNLTCPLQIEGRPIGFLFFTSASPQAYRAAHESIFLQIAGQVSAIIEKGRLYERLVEHNRMLLARTRRLEAMATHDALTGVFNRRAVDDALAAELTRGDARIGVIMADIDHFKTVNDTLGHAAGDRVLQEFVRRVAGAMRKRDAIGRYGGEEFLVILDDVTPDEALAMAERLREAVRSTPFDIAGRQVAVTASFGVAANGRPGSTVGADLVERADRALYAAKARGRDRCALAAS